MGHGPRPQHPTAFASPRESCGGPTPRRVTPSIWTSGTTTWIRREARGRMTKDDAGPVFREPWEAQAFGMAGGASPPGAVSREEGGRRLAPARTPGPAPRGAGGGGAPAPLLRAPPPGRG